MSEPRHRTDKVPLALQILEVKRELGYRARVYKRLVDDGKMKLDDAERHTKTMEAVLETLQWVQEGERLL